MTTAQEVLAELERLREKALQRDVLSEFERMVLACWPTIRVALDQLFDKARRDVNGT